MSLFKLRVGVVPEHFSTPIHFAEHQGYYKEAGLDVEFIPFPAGSGHLIQCLNNNEIDIAIGLTEAFIASLAKGNDSFKFVGTYVNSPLCWAISTGANRDELTDAKQLNGKRIGISRIGSGSYVMPFVLALSNEFNKPYFSGFPICTNFKNLRDSVNLKGDESLHSEAFMWEHFTSKKYYDNGEIKKIGEIYTPWPSWCINARSSLVEENSKQIQAFLASLNKGIKYFKDNTDEGIKYIYTNLDYSEEDAREWLKTVEFNDKLGEKPIDWEKVVENTAKVLTTAGVLEDEEQVINDRLVAGVKSL